MLRPLQQHPFSWGEAQPFTGLRVNPQAQWDFTFCHSFSSLFPANWSTCYCFTCARCISVSGSWSFLYLYLADSSSSVYFLQMTSQSRSFWPLHLTLQFFSTPTSNSFPALFLFFFLSVWLSNTTRGMKHEGRDFFLFPSTLFGTMNKAWVHGDATEAFC